MPHRNICLICLNVTIGQTSQLQLTCQICRLPLREDFEHGHLVCPDCGRVTVVTGAITVLEGVWFQIATLLNALREAAGTARTARELFVEASQMAQFIAPFI